MTKQNTGLFALSDGLAKNGITAKKTPPLELWNPEYCGEIDLVIKANGDWFHEGIKMTRQNLVDLFATVLWREENDYFLKTPAEKVKITVEDVPLLIISIDQVVLDNQQTGFLCTTKTGDAVVISEAHPIELREFQLHNGQLEIRPYVLIRRNLWALIHRNAFYHLIEQSELLEKDDKLALKIQSDGTVFELESHGVTQLL